MDLSKFIFNSNTLIGIGTVIFAIGYIVKNFIMGGNQAESRLASANRDLIDNLTAQLQIEKDRGVNLQNQVNEQAKLIGGLQGELRTYKEIAENRSPTLEKTLLGLTDLLEKRTKFFVEILADVEELKKIGVGKGSKTTTTTETKLK